MMESLGRLLEGRGLALFLFVLVLAYTIYVHRHIDNLQFVIIVILLTIILWMILDANGSTQWMFEGFEAADPEPAPAAAPPAGGSPNAKSGTQQEQKEPEVMTSPWNLKVLGLPNEIKGIIVPELDYVISSASGKKKEGEKGKESDNETVDLDESEYVSKKDPDVTIKNGSKVEIDAAKMGQLRLEYNQIDSALTAFKEVEPELWAKLVGQ